MTDDNDFDPEFKKEAHEATNICRKHISYALIKIMGDYGAGLYDPRAGAVGLITALTYTLGRQLYAAEVGAGLNKLCWEGITNTIREAYLEAQAEAGKITPKEADDALNDALADAMRAIKGNETTH